MFNLEKITDDQAIGLAQAIVNDKTKNLRFDVNRCMMKDSEGNAPLSALLYCFAMIDFMGALYAGQGGKKDMNNKNVDTSNNAKKMSLQFLGYEYDSIEIIWQMFRHKTIHVSMPETVFEFDNRRISWELNDDNKANHLQILPRSITESGIIPIGNTRINLEYDHKFVIHIETLSNDIIKSMHKYLDALEKDKALLGKFKAAVHEIYVVKRVVKK
ncbi:hypothetical protein NMY3_03031 [Candidatus Nitrosocosmicus oleophilus]|uniref:Uncharacterized protein n=1 Tax=Candidatus Nitrosocosmicus oleophilus TaxID=1353260 RepID=A0A654M0G3_9ARCH|nr:hypothetical protein [Candidatus Nitrosocosmicus oleophilus]ALI37218.1 hypothetical protein NMY3_03031 [Candidatus Nitrosocosmicus oleophilus]